MNMVSARRRAGRRTGSAAIRNKMPLVDPIPALLPPRRRGGHQGRAKWSTSPVGLIVGHSLRSPYPVKNVWVDVFSALLFKCLKQNIGLLNIFVFVHVQCVVYLFNNFNTTLRSNC